MEYSICTSGSNIWRTLYATLHGMDISLLPVPEKTHNFHKEASIFKIRVMFFF